MNYAIISDIHGYAKTLSDALKWSDKFNCRHILLLGDLIYHGPRNRIAEHLDPQGTIELLNARKERIIAVRGNCDAEVDQMVLEFPVMSPVNILVSGDRRIVMHHGHRQDSLKLALTRGDLVLSGHTHVACCSVTDGVTFFNPGSVSLPKKSPFGTMGVYREREGTLLTVEVSSGRILETFALPDMI